MKLLTTGNPKMVKGEKKGYLTFILHLAPAKISGYNLCPMASKGCAAVCLNTSGRGIYQRTQDARIRRSKMFMEQRNDFMALLVKDIEAGIRKAKRNGMIPAFRLNGTSDIRWENIEVFEIDDKTATLWPNLMTKFQDVQFYDYTKLPNRTDIPKNYHLTFSASESNSAHVELAIDKGMNVAVVFKSRPEAYLGLPVIDGDETDLRFLDAKSVIVGLSAKGKAKKDNSGFVR